MPHATATPIDEATIARVADRFLSPRRAPAKPWPAAGAPATLAVPAPAGWPDGAEVALVCHRLGEGPPVLLVHGWQSQAADLLGAARALAAAGLSVWAPDLPAHGHSGGQRLSIPLAAQALHAVQRLAGPFAAVVGHSYGAAALVHALAGGLAAARAALLAPPTHYGIHARHAAQAAGLDAAATERLLQRLQALTGEAPDAIDMRRQAAALRLPALLLHADDDPVVPAHATRRVAEAWPGARWRPLQGLGHFRLLDDPGVLAEVAQFARGA